VLLLDEITVDMDVVGRLDLLHFFEEECAQRGATIVYATHIFDGLEKWVTHLAYVADGKLEKGGHASPYRLGSLDYLNSVRGVGLGGVGEMVYIVNVVLCIASTSRLHHQTLAPPPPPPLPPLSASHPPLPFRSHILSGWHSGQHS